jgi:hypothetical protein
MEHLMKHYLARPLDDIDLREEETDDGVLANGRIELATFAEGEYVESILLDRRRATEIYRDLGKILGDSASHSATECVVNQSFSDRETSTILTALRYWQDNGPMSAGGELDVAENGGCSTALSAIEIDSLCEKINWTDHRSSDA